MSLEQGEAREMMNGALLGAAKDLEALKEENAELMGTITRLRGENLDSHKQIKEQLGLLQIRFNPGPKDDEGNFDVVFPNIINPVPPLKAKDVLGYPAFRKKIMGLTGRLLPNVDKTAWELFLQDNIQGLNSSL